MKKRFIFGILALLLGVMLIFVSCTPKTEVTKTAVDTAPSTGETTSPSETSDYTTEPTQSPVATPTGTVTPAPTPVATPTPVPTPVATTTPVPTPITPTPTPTPVATPTPVPTPITPTPTPTPVATPTPTPTPVPTPIIPTPTPTPEPPFDIYDQFGDRKLNGSIYSNNFECWPVDGNDNYCPRAFFQACVVIPYSEIDIRTNMGSDNYAYSFKFYYRAAGSESEFKGPYTVPTETFYPQGNSAIYRFLVTEAPEGNMLDSWVIDERYETVVSIFENGVNRGYLDLTMSWNSDYNDDYTVYKTFWIRHDRDEGYLNGQQTLTESDINDPYGKWLKYESNDGNDRSNMQQFADQGMGYGGVIREKSTGDILFSPNLSAFRNYLQNLGVSTTGGQIIEGYTGRLVVTIQGYDGEEFYTYKDLYLPIYESKGAWYDFFLQGEVGGERIDCGFCPLAGRTYNIYFELISDKEKKVLYYGVWNDITTPESLAENEYYNGKPVPGEENLKYTVTFEAKNPVGGSIKGVTSYTLGYGEKTGSVTAVPAEGYVFSRWSDGVTDAIHPAVTVNRTMTIYATFTKEGTGDTVSDMYLTTDTGSPITNKDTYITGSVKIVSAIEGFSMSEVTMQIRGRGNSSWNAYAPQNSYDSKNSYRLKLDVKQSVLGMDPNRDWVLNSNKFDGIGLRTWSMWQLASYMNTLPYYGEGEFVNLYVNGTYRGMYFVCELIEVAKGRVEVDDNVNSTDKGFLLEIDFRGNIDAVRYSPTMNFNSAETRDYYFYVAGYGDTNTNPIEFVIKSNVDSTADITAIYDYIMLCHKAILLGDRTQIEKYIDIPSLIDMYIIEEFSLDVDVGAASFYMQKNPSGKLYFTAPWDFDFGFGTYGPAVGYTGFHSCYATGDSNGIWFKELFERKWFRQAVLDRMKELDKSSMESFYSDIENKAADIYIAADKNFTFWNMYGNNFHNYVSGSASSALFSFEDHYDYLVNWMKNRWKWMEDNIMTWEYL